MHEINYNCARKTHYSFVRYFLVLQHSGFDCSNTETVSLPFLLIKVGLPSKLLVWTAHVWKRYALQLRALK